MSRSHSGGLSHVRTSSPRPSFGRASAMRASLAETAKSIRASDLVREKAVAHFAKHSEKWIDRQFRVNLLTSAQTRTLTPSGVATDPAAVAKARAIAMVKARQTQRLARIDRAAKTLTSGAGSLRNSRKVGWGAEASQRGRSRGDAGVARQAAVQKLGAVARTNAEAHAAKNGAAWKESRFRALAAQLHLPSPERQTQKQKDLVRIAEQVAARSVEAKQDRRLYLIEKACHRMASGASAIRASRGLGQGAGLGR